MGRGRGGYTEIQAFYRDSGGKKVTDSGAKFVAERYIDEGYMSVFRQTHDNEKTYDLTIKSSDDKSFIKNIEVKQVTSNNSSKIADNIKKANTQINDGDTIAIYLPGHKNDEAGRKFASVGIKEAIAKQWKKGPIEVWFSDKTRIEY